MSHVKSGLQMSADENLQNNGFQNNGFIIEMDVL